MALTQISIPPVVSLAGNPIYISYSTNKNSEDFIGIHLKVYTVNDASWNLQGDELRYEPDSTGKIEVDIQKLLEWDPNKEFTWPDVDADLITHQANLLKQYKVEVSEKYGNPLTEDDTDTVFGLFVLPGSISKLQQGYLNSISDTWLENQSSSNKFLTNSPTKKTDVWASERLYFLIINNPYAGRVNLKVRIDYIGSSATHTAETIRYIYDHYILHLVTSFSTLLLGLIDNEKEVLQYTVWLTSGNDTILSEEFTYTMDNVRHSNTKYFIFNNAFKVAEGARFTSQYKESSNYSFQKSQRTLDKGFNMDSPSLIKSNTQETKSCEITSDWLTIEEMNWLRELLTSESVYEIVNGNLIPVFIDTESVNILEGNNNLRALSISYIYAHPDKVPVISI